MRGSVWTLLVLSALVGAWLLWSASGNTAQPPPPAEALAQPLPVESPCLELPQAEEVPPPAVPPAIRGRVGLYVARFPPRHGEAAGESEFRPSKVVQIAPQEVFPLASNYKTAVWLEVLRQADQGSLDLAERFVVTQANQSLGDYPYDNTPVLGLAYRMIEWSDNTATDILHRRVGLGSLQPLAEELKLCKTRLLLPTKAWWTAESGLGGADFPRYKLISSSQRFAQASSEERLQIAQRLDTVAQSLHPDRLYRALKTFYGGGYTWEQMAQIDRNLQNASTPLEWARFLWWAFTQNGLSPQNDRRFREVMAKGYGSRRLRVRYSYFGGKSGNTAGVLGFSGYLEAPDGSRYVYVFLCDTIPEVNTFNLAPPAFGLINEALLRLGMKGR
ncbi:serine hydrolase [Calidithermus timidus]|uniref:serine hydrolase n=1 Tax=Calidithermus timidus TaxID=307124 RepID=UPI0003AA46E3|nr:serine hydrolase [Calidithermus timidus]